MKTYLRVSSMEKDRTSPIVFGGGTTFLLFTLFLSLFLKFNNPIRMLLIVFRKKVFLINTVDLLKIHQNVNSHSLFEYLHFLFGNVLRQLNSFFWNSFFLATTWYWKGMLIRKSKYLKNSTTHHIWMWGCRPENERLRLPVFIDGFFSIFPLFLHSLSVYEYR